MSAIRLQSWAAPAAFILLLVALGSVGHMAPVDVVWFSLAAAVFFGPSGAVAPGGWRRRAAEALLIPAGLAAVLVAGEVLRQMLLPSLIVAAGWMAWSAAVRGLQTRGAAVLTGFFGLGIRAAIGVCSLSSGWVELLGSFVVSFVGPWVVARFDRSAGVLFALLLTSIPTPWAFMLVIPVLGVAFAVRRGEAGSPPGPRPWIGWFPLVGAAAMVSVAVARWGVPEPNLLFWGSNWVSWVGLTCVLLVSLRLPPAAAGACAVLGLLLLGPAGPPAPEGGGLVLGSDHPKALLRQGTGGTYLLDVAVANGVGVGTGATVARIQIGDREVGLRLGMQVPDWMPETAAAAGRNPLQVDHLVIRPPAEVGSTWRHAGRIGFEVPAGARPVIVRNPKIKAEARVLVLASGPSHPVSPRSSTADRWLWWAAALVALIQLLSGTWQASWSWLPWMILATGMAATRMAVEPLFLLVQRHGVDLALAAVMVAWVPAAIRLMSRGRFVLAAATLLLPIAAATAHLTPPMWGDEPYHLALMESVSADGDIDISNNLLDGGGSVSLLVRRIDTLFHSPVLAFLLLPGYWLFGRAGALVLLGLCGALTVALVASRLKSWISPQRRVVLIVAVLACVTYPLATFSSQIWPGVLGALIVAGCLALAPRGRLANGFGVVLAFLAAAIKTRLALVTFPIVCVGWWRQGRRRRAVGGFLIGGAAIAALVVGWMAMGHPFGFFRRAPDLLPTDLGLALRVVAGLLFDISGGFAWTAPLWLLALVAVPQLWRDGGPGERALVIGGAATVFALLGSSEWYGGGSPPGRYLVPLMPAVFLALGLLISRPSPRRQMIWVLLPPSLVAWWALVTRPHFSINSGDGGWWLSNSLARSFAADSRSLFPSFLCPSKATIVVPVVIVGVGVLLWVVTSRATIARTLARIAPALWLVAAAGLVVTLGIRFDGVVEAEAAQIRRSGGRPVPPAGTMARSSYTNGWRIASGNRIRAPLRLRADDAVHLDGWVTPDGTEATLMIGWDGSDLIPVAVKGTFDGVLIPVQAPVTGRRWLTIECRTPKASTVVIDRIVIERSRTVNVE